MPDNGVKYTNDPATGGNPEVVGTTDQYTGAAVAESGDLNERIGFNKWDHFKQEFELAVHDNPLGLPGNPGALLRRYGEWTQTFDGERGVKLSAKDANERFPGVGFTEDISPDIAQQRYSEKQRIDDLKNLIARGPETSGTTGALTGAALFGGVGLLTGGPVGGIAGALSGGIFGAMGGPAGVAAGALDPLNYLPGIVSNRMFNAAGLATKIPKAWLLPTAFATNLLENAPQQIASSTQLQREGRSEVTLEDTLANIFMGAAVGTAVHATVDKITARARARMEINAKVRELEAKGIPEETRQKAARLVVAQTEMGQKINPEAALREAQMRLAGDVKPGEIDEFQFVPFDQPDGRIFYVVTDPKDGAPGNWGGEHGEGVYGTDKSRAARNQGDAHAVEVSPDARFLDLDTPLTDEGPSGKTMATVLESVLGDKLDVANASTFGDLLNNIHAAIDAGVLPEDVATKIQEKLREAGIDGYKSVYSVDGVPKHNVIVLFNEAKAKSLGYMPYDPSLVPTNESGMAQAAQDLTDPDKSFAHSPDVDDDIKRSKSEVAVTPETDRMENLKRQEAQAGSFIKQMVTQLKDVPEGEPLSPAQKRVEEYINKSIEDIETAHQRELEENQTAKELADCVIKGLS